jgi:two-component system chemotaxis response regulator CheB
MKAIRVLIVDDSTVIRRLLSDSLSSDPQIEVVGTAAHGKIALAKIPQFNPDVVTLDMEMPEMDGITTLVEIRKLYPKLPVIMFSTLTERGATATLEALSKGANDYVTKPANVGSVNAAMQSVREELIPRLKALCLSSTAKTTTPIGTRSVRTASKGSLVKNRVDVVAIGSSTGGPNALQEIIPRLPADFPIPILIVQHMPPIFTRHLAERLNQLSQLTVTEAKQGDSIHAGGVWIAPGDFHLRLKRVANDVQVQLDRGIPENSCRPAVDVMFRSAESIYGGNLLAVVLTGMGQDGARGCEPIRAAGGEVFIQDEVTSVVWGMPGAVHRSGLASSVHSLSQMASAIGNAASRNRGAQKLGVLSCL